MVPAATPKAIVAKLNQAMADYLHSPEGIAQMKTLGAEAVGSTPEALDVLIKHEERALGRGDQDGKPDDPMRSGLDE